MKSIFDRGLSLRFRFIIAILLSLCIMVVDSRLHILNASHKILNSMSIFFSLQNQLMIKNKVLQEELFLKSSELLMLEQYKQENTRLRKLLSSPIHPDEKKMITQVITSNDPHINQVIIDRGSINGVYKGQPIINDKGIVGQVITVSKLTSRVILICNKNHALPVQVLRSDIRFILVGNGCNNDFQAKHVPMNADVCVGDILVTSGLDGRFPEGYPVATISFVEKDSRHDYITIKANPIVDFRYLRYLLLLWNTNQYINKAVIPEEVHRIVKTND